MGQTISYHWRSKRAKETILTGRGALVTPPAIAAGITEGEKEFLTSKIFSGEKVRPFA